MYQHLLGHLVNLLLSSPASKGEVSSTCNAMLILMEDPVMLVSVIVFAYSFYHHLWSQGRHQEKNIYFGALIKLPPSPLPVFQGCLFPTLFSRMDVDSFEMICFHCSAGCSGSRQLAATDKGVLCSQLRTSTAAAPLHASDNIQTPDPGSEIPDSRFKTYVFSPATTGHLQLHTSDNISKTKTK